MKKKCSRCGGKLRWAEDSWICSKCGDEWPDDDEPEETGHTYTDKYTVRVKE